MDVQRAQASEILESSFQLKHTPIALTFVNEAPENINTLETDVPSWCSLWCKAESEVFFAPNEKHYNCPVGAMVMGIELPDHVKDELNTVVNLMCNSNYIDPDEPDKIPSYGKMCSGMVYGPLKDIPVEPHVVLIWLNSKQAMFLSEAMGTCKWTKDIKAMALGRPACSSIPLSIAESSNMLSFGCIGMRTYTEISDENILTVLSYGEIYSLLGNIKVMEKANQQLQKYYDGNKSKFSG